MQPKHNLLKRQLKKCFGDPDVIDKKWQNFIDVVNDAYNQFDIDRNMLERSLDLSSQELLQVNSEMKTLISLLNATIESTADGMLVVDNNGKIVSFNKKFIEMWHIPQFIMNLRDDAKVLAFALDQLNDPESFIKKVRELYAEPNAESYDMLDFKDGRIFERYSQPQKIEGKAVGRVWSFRNITERIKAEEERRRLEELLSRSEKMEALGTLAGGVAHDLNNVLGIVVGYSELLLNEVNESSPIRPHLTKIMNGSEKAATVVQDLLTLARRGVPVRKVLNLNDIILDYQNSPELEKLFSYHPAVRINTDLEADLLNISASPIHMEKTFFNLVSNAVEAMPKGGNLTIRTTNQYLDKPIYGYDNIHEGDYVVLSVADTGEGIPSADLQRIFEPFYTKKMMGRSGTGLGLAVVWGTVKDHQGYINVKSEEGKGSTFTLYFPVTREDVAAIPASISMSTYMGKGETILVVDDVGEQRDLATDMLNKCNYQVASVSSGEDAIEYLKEHKVDLLVLDMIMDPGMDGLDTYRSVLKIYPKQKAIIVSGFSESERVHAAHALGAGEYVKKPYVIEKLGMAVRFELDRST